MREKSSLNVTQTEEPAGRWCSTGHIPPEQFVIDGNAAPMRFFSVEGSTVSGVYCELCLSVVNKYVQIVKKVSK